jgi:hypothetical protein
MDWKTIVSTLSEAYAQKDIATYCNLDNAAVTRLKQGVLMRVEYSNGCKLLAMHRRAVKKLRREAERRLAR